MEAVVISACSLQSNPFIAVPAQLESSLNLIIRHASQVCIKFTLILVQIKKPHMRIYRNVNNQTETFSVPRSQLYTLKISLLLHLF